MTSKWEHLKQRIARDRDGEQRSARPRFLLCFEDSVSAPNYFEALRIDKRLRKVTFIVDLDPSGSDPLSVVKRAEELRDEYRQSGDMDEEDQVWCIVDVNGHTTFNDAKQRADSEGINLAISNPCFEYWIWLHFEDTAPGFTNCDEVIRHLKKKHIKDYKKGSYEYSQIVERADLAAGRARCKFEEKAEPDPLKCCPCTMLFELIEAIANIPSS